MLIVPYDSAWPTAFAHERAALRRIFPPSHAKIEHSVAGSITEYERLLPGWWW